MPGAKKKKAMRQPQREGWLEVYEEIQAERRKMKVRAAARGDRTRARRQARSRAHLSPVCASDATPAHARSARAAPRASSSG